MSPNAMPAGAPPSARRILVIALAVLALAAGWRPPPAIAGAPLAAPAGLAGNLPGDLAIDLHFDLAADSLGELDPAAGAAPAGEITIAGIPLHVSAAEGPVGWRSLAGARGRYSLELGDGLSLIARGALTSKDFVDAATADSTVALASGELRYARGGWTLGLQPGVEATRWTSGVVQRDVMVEARAAAPLGDGIRLSTTLGHRWRETDGAAPRHREIAFGRLGLVCDLPRRARLDLGLAARREIADVLSLSGGPTAALSLPLGETVELSADYGYTATARRPVSALPGVPREDLHRLGLAMSWDIGGDALDADFSAGYRFELGDATGRDADSRHTGTLKLALGF